MSEPERNLPRQPDTASPARPPRAPLLGCPERLALAIYGACLVLVLVLYHFQ